MILTLSHNDININNGKIFFSLKDLEERFKTSKVNRSYKANIANIEYELLCPEIISEKGEKEVLWPSFKLPYRKYPVYVYIYVAALYLSTDKSMRDVATEVRRKFGLEKFSHSTVSRSLKKLTENIDILASLNQDENNNLEIPVKRKKWSVQKEDLMLKLFKIISPILEESNTKDFGSMLNFKFFNETGKFIL
jgi:hypothetical protein